MEAEQVLLESSHLSELSRVLSERFSSLTIRTCQLKNDPGKDFLHITQHSLDNSELEYLPTFHIIIKIEEDQGSILSKFELTLLSYNGKILSKEEVSWASTEYIPSSIYLDRLNSGSMRLCKGVTDSRTENVGFPSNLVREFQDNAIALRSQECTYAVIQIDSQVDLKTQCKFCSTVSFGSSTSAHFDSSKSDTERYYDTVKDEPQLDLEATSQEEGFRKMNCLELVNARRKRKSRRSNLLDSSPVRKSRQQQKKYIKCQKEEENSDYDDFDPHDDFQVNFNSDDQLELEEDKSTPGACEEEEEEEQEPQNGNNNAKEKCLKTCKKCGREYKSKYTYFKHIQKCQHGKEDPKFSEHCKICLKHFYQKKQLERHLDYHRSKHNLDDPIVCPECNETLKTKLDLNPHFQSSHSPDKGCCIECLEVLENSQLQRHLYSRHFYNVKDRLCTSCGETFATPLKLRVHISSVHDDTGTACVCEQCGKFFPHKIKLNHHIYHHHNTTRPYPCHSCDKVFYNPMAFYKHVKIHSTVKPFYCELCGYRAVRKDNVQQHVRKVHKIEDSAVHVFKDGKFKYEAVERKKQEEMENNMYRAEEGKLGKPEKHS